MRGNLAMEPHRSEVSVAIPASVDPSPQSSPRRGEEANAAREARYLS